MQAVADYIVSRGRVSIAELANKSSTLIDLEARGVPAATGAAGEPCQELDAEALMMDLAE
jgi:hypothetical protein